MKHEVKCLNIMSLIPARSVLFGYDVKSLFLFFQVLAAYYTFTGDGNFRKEEEVLAIFNKKVTKNPKFRVLKERVRLIK